MTTTTVVLATHNPGKLAELQAMFSGIGVRLLPQRETGIAPTPEPHATFLENALAKARHAARASGLPALADDSGLCVSALAGAPGVRSARFAALHDAGEGDTDNNRVLLRQLRESGTADRSARFVCVLVALRFADDPEPLVSHGRWEGRIALQPRGSAGFGYDPVFEVASLGLSAAEMAPELKNRLSHRGQAVQAMLALMRSAWGR